MRKNKKIIFAVLVAALVGSLVFAFVQKSVIQETPSTPVSKAFKDYWYQGKAEVVAYELEQARYGEIHKGYAVLIFVTEPFSKSRHVKLNDPSSPGYDAVSVLKLNFTKKFLTGIYPYSLMQSTFTPVDREQYPKSFMTTFSGQEWCGHAYTEAHLMGKNHYKVNGWSYFEDEEKTHQEIDGAILEDEIWNLVRMGPDQLPTGNIKMIPGFFYLRLRHVTPKAEDVAATLKDHESDPNIKVYSLAYPDLDRTLSIHYKNEFPYPIEYWEETYTSGFGDDAKKLTTKARKKEMLFIDYWNKNSNADLELRKQLGL